VADEGSAEPYIARLWLGVCELRDLLLGHQAKSEEDLAGRRRQFDKLYVPVLDALSAARTQARAIRGLVDAHRERVAAGVAISRDRNALHINEAIELELQNRLAAFLPAAARAAKLLQELVAYLGTDIGCLFQKRSSFEAALEKLRVDGDNQLAKYLASTRAGWSETLMHRRNALEHEGRSLPDGRYVEEPSGFVSFLEPQIDGIAVSHFVEHVLGQTLAFVEDMVALCAQRGIADVGNLIDIPKDQRDPGNVKRFRLGVPVLQSHEQFWELRYSEGGFDVT
jgi:hypothetical protein